jgi:hypothetical protein
MNLNKSKILSILLPVLHSVGCLSDHCEVYPQHCVEEGTADELDGGTEGGTDEATLQLTVNKDVDILFVIDNSGSMGEEQANLATHFGALVGVLEAPDVEANYRIGVTTSDNGNPWCPLGTTTPEGGNLVLSSCKSRIGDFIFNDSVDVQDLACNDICTLTEAELEVVPTATDVDANLVARPWLESIEGNKNIPAETDTAEAFKCFGPQGVNGCGFESQLESMYFSLTRNFTEGQANYGFLRDGAILAIVIVTDEVDCSYNKDWADIFEQDGNKVFWSDPAASFPTSAVCWNAGVECTGDPSGYDSCEPVNKDINGNIGANDDDAVLHPMSRYIDLIQGIEDAKKNLDPDQEVIVALIGGVSEGGDVFYADDLIDPVFQDSFGIGAGCTAAGNVTAVPPVRMRVFTDTFTPDNMFSICSLDYTPALEQIAAKIRDQIEPACYSQCVEDTDLSTAVLEPDCTVEQESPGIEGLQLQECMRDDNGSYSIVPGTNDYTMPADSANACYVLLADPDGQTGDPNDDMSTECSDLHYNLEFAIARRPGWPAPASTSVSATCSLADSPQVDCPNLSIP